MLDFFHRNPWDYPDWDGDESNLYYIDSYNDGYEDCELDDDFEEDEL